MHSGDLTPKQVDELHDHVAQAHAYLAALHRRMEEREFSHADRLYWEVSNARYALQILADHLHRLRCGPSYGGGKD